MGLIVAGIDEAGYGPLLGPMCVGMSAFRVEGEFGEADELDLWARLSPAVSRGAGRSRSSAGSVAIADSKKLKLPNDSTRAHPLTYLERGVLSVLRARRDGAGEVGSDSELLAALGASYGGHECYGGECVGLPVAGSGAQLGIWANLVSGAMERAGISVVAMRCEVVCEPEFNRLARSAESKAEVTIDRLGVYLGELWRGFVGGADGVRLVCDRLGGRAAYAEVLARLMSGIEPGGVVRAIAQDERVSRYRIEGARGSMDVAFEVESEERHLPVALASMIAKFVRELAMTRFNRYWSRRFREAGVGVELKPTAGYALDARRWLKDASGVLTAKDREGLVRVV